MPLSMVSTRLPKAAASSTSHLLRRAGGPPASADDVLVKGVPSASSGPGDPTPEPFCGRIAAMEAAHASGRRSYRHCNPYYPTGRQNTPERALLEEPSPRYGYEHRKHILCRFRPQTPIRQRKPCVDHCRTSGRFDTLTRRWYKARTLEGVGTLLGEYRKEL